MVEGGGVHVGVVHFEVDLVLAEAADVDPLRCAVAAAEADGGLAEQQFFEVGVGGFVDFLGGDAVGGEVRAFDGNGFEAAFGGGGVFGMGEACGEGEGEQAESDG